MEKKVNKFLMSCANEDEGDDDEIMDLLMQRRNIFASDNDVYMFDEIDPQSQLLLEKALLGAKKFLLSKYGESMQFTDGILPYPIKLHINSPGGEAYSSLALYDFIKNFDIPIVGVVEGMAASGASLVLCGCHFKTMTENSVILAHEVRSVKGLTKYTEEKDAFANDNELMDKLKKIYLAETKVSKKDIDDILSHDRYWDADKCLKIGFIDAIIGREEKKVTHKKTTKKSKTSKNNPSIEKQESVESKDDSSIEKPEKPESISIKNSD